LSLAKQTRFGPNPIFDQEIATKNYVDNAGTGKTFAKVFKTVDETIQSDTVLHDDDELFVAVNANKIYHFQMLIISDSPASADLKRAFSIPSGATGSRLNGLFSASSTVVQVNITTSDGIATAGLAYFYESGMLITDSTPGTLQYQWAQNQSQALDSTIKKGSFMVVWES